MLQELEPDTCDRTATFLRGRLNGSAGVVDLFSFLVAAFLVRVGGGPDVLAEAPPDWPDRLAGTLETFRHPDGGYAKTPEGTSGSTYTTFLVALALELLGKTVPNPERLCSFLRHRFRDGGFVEIPQMKRAGTNPTAAAVGTLQILGALDDQTRPRARVPGPLWRRPTRAGSELMTASPRPTYCPHSPAAGPWPTSARSTASTGPPCSGTRTLSRDRTAGSAAACGTTGMDVEYTFYGIGVLGLLAAE